MQGVGGGGIEDVVGKGAEEEVEGELGESALGFGTQDCVRLEGVSYVPQD